MQKIEQIPARIKIAHELKAAILNGQIEPLTELIQENIASLLGVSRTPVREAFQLLEKDGFIELVNSKKAIVRRFDAKDVEEHYELRAILEGQVTYKATLNHMEVSLLTHLIQDMNELVGTHHFIEKNHVFHQTIWEASNSPKHVEFIQHLWNRIPAEFVSISKEDQLQANQEHQAIVSAIINQDAHLAKEMMMNHILRTKQDYLKRLEQTKPF